MFRQMFRIFLANIAKYLVMVCCMMNLDSNKSLKALQICRIKFIYWRVETVDFHPLIIIYLNWMITIILYLVFPSLLVITNCGEAKPQNIHIHLHEKEVSKASSRRVDGDFSQTENCTDWWDNVPLARCPQGCPPTKLKKWLCNECGGWMRKCPRVCPPKWHG